MKIFISADMEGIAAVVDDTGTTPGLDEYEVTRLRMTREVNAAAEGAFAAGATRVVVNDAHNTMRNIVPEELHPDVELIRGYVKPLRMVQGLDESFAATFLVGYHARTGTPHAIMNHTLTAGQMLMDMSLNGTLIGEIALNAGMAGTLGVPVALLTGDAAAVAEARELLGDIETVTTKEGIDRFTAACRHPQRVCEDIRAAAERAARRARDIHPLAVSPPYRLAIRFVSTVMASVAAYLPGAEQEDSRTAAYTAQSYPELFRAYAALLILARSALNPNY